MREGKSMGWRMRLALDGTRLQFVGSHRALWRAPTNNKWIRHHALAPPPPNLISLLRAALFDKLASVKTHPPAGACSVCAGRFSPTHTFQLDWLCLHSLFGRRRAYLTRGVECKEDESCFCRPRARANKKSFRSPLARPPRACQPPACLSFHKYTNQILGARARACALGSPCFY